MVNHAMGDWRVMLRYYYFGDWYSDYDSDSGADDEDGTPDDVVTNYDGYGLTDISITRRINDHFSMSLGSDNIFDQTPDRSIKGASRGNQYPRFAPGGIDGRFIYGRVMLEF